MLPLLALAAQITAPDPVLARMTALYDEVCVQTFPIDSAVDQLMAGKQATVLTPDRVAIYLKSDPGRGWQVADGGDHFIVTVEAPPFHACTVRRWTRGGFSDLAAYRSVADRFEAAHEGFSPMKPRDGDVGGIRSHATGEARLLPGGGAEAMYVFDNHDAAAGARGEPDVGIRFVHQIVSPGAH